MKSLLVTVILLLLVVRTKAVDLIVQTNATGIMNGDSQWSDVSGDSPVTGFRTPDEVAAGIKTLQPYKNTHFFNWSQSGVIPDRMLTNNMPQAIGLWCFQSNAFQKIGVEMSTDNGAYTSNQMYLQHSNMFQGITLLSSGDLTLVANPGQCAIAHVDWIGCGNPPAPSTDGSPLTEGQRNNASTNAGWKLGIRGTDSFNILSNSWMNDFNNNNSANVQFILSGPKGGHYLSGGALSWVLVLLSDWFPSLTNTTLCSVGWDGTINTTNNCLVTGVTHGSSLAFDLIEYSLPPGYDHAGDVVADGTITNTADLAFNLDPSFSNSFHQTFQITGLPAGTYNVTEDGEQSFTAYSSALATGVNRFTITKGPSWRKRVLVLADVRTVEHINQVTLLAGSASDQQGMVAYGSVANGQWIAGNRGDAFIAAMNNAASNVFYLDNIANSDAQPVTRHMVVVPVIVGGPAPFRR